MWVGMTGCRCFVHAVQGARECWHLDSLYSLVAVEAGFPLPVAEGSFTHMSFALPETYDICAVETE